MCGIGGIVRLDDRPIDPDRARRMLAHLRHRGPDGEGIHHHDHCTLVHARLAIVDPPGGRQPMHLPHDPCPTASQVGSHGGLTIVFNGEIYNHRELRRTLEARGQRFRSDHSDTEVLLLGYRQWGDDLPRHVHGMFAVAIWDAAERRLVLIRDRMGKKPLFLRRTARSVAFASVVAALVDDPADDSAAAAPTVDRAALATFLRYGYSFERSLIAGVEEAPPAHWIAIERDGSMRPRRYWRPPPISMAPASSGALDALGEVLTDAVDARLDADVPLGCFLSGGVDSSLVAALAQRRIAERGGPALRTFSVAMPHRDYDESPHAQAVAQHIGARHTVLHTPHAEAIEDLRHLMSLTGEPTADSSLLATYWLCRAAREHVKATLSGDGGDELFGGYDRYRAMRLLHRWRRPLAMLPNAVLRSSDARSHRTRLRRLADAARAGRDPAAQYQRMIHLFDETQIRELGLASAAGDAAAPGWPDDLDPVHAAMRWDQAHYLPFDLLRKVDRASMAVALEVRCPMLDTQVVELAAHLPNHVLMPGGRPKGLLRLLAANHLPRHIVRRPKRGFAIPIGDWFRTSLRRPLADHLLGGDLDALGLDPAPVQRLFEEHTSGQADHTHRLFALLQLSLWANWMRG